MLLVLRRKSERMRGCHDRGVFHCCAGHHLTGEVEGVVKKKEAETGEGVDKSTWIKHDRGFKSFLKRANAVKGKALRTKRTKGRGNG